MKSTFHCLHKKFINLLTLFCFMNQFKDLDQEKEAFITHLVIKQLQVSTIERYMDYYDKLKEIREAVGTMELNQEIVNGFLKLYYYGIPRAFLKNFLKFIHRKDLEIESISGREKRKKIVLIPDHHINMIRSYLFNKDMKYFLMFETSLVGALRRAEVVNMKLQNLNTEEYNVAKQQNKNIPITIKLTKTKGNKERYVVLPYALVKELEKYADEKRVPDSEKLFPIKEIQWWRVFNKACLDLGLTKIDENGKKVAIYHPHSIRHTTSSQWWENGVDIVSIQMRLGHENIETTRKYITPNEKKELEKWNEEYNV